MKLKSFRIQNFRSVIDSTEIRVADVTVLIGPNQSGKSSILQGLDKLSFDAKFSDFDLTQLHGINKRYVDGELSAPQLPIVSAIFDISEEERNQLREVFPEVEDAPTELTITKTYDNWFRFSIAGKQVEFPSRTIVEAGKTSLLQKLQEIDSWARQQHLNRSPNQQHQQAFNTAIEAVRTSLSEPAFKGGTPPALDSIKPKLGSLVESRFDEQFKKELTQRISDLEKIAENSFPLTARESRLYEYFLKHIPRTVYFKTYERLDDEATLDELEQSAERFRTFRNLLKIADLRVQSLRALTNEMQKHPYVEAASGRVTKLLRSAWGQEQLELEMRLSGNRLTVFTKDSLAVETLLPPSSGSEGFQWWLSFYIHFGASTESEYKRAILLLDDPGVYLHPTAHRDLLKLFEEYLTHDVTTIYTTQIPFLIPRNRLSRIRLVTKDKSGASCVEEKFYRGQDTDVLAPIRAALGITLGDSLFAGEVTFVVEGLSDRILLTAILEAFQTHKLRPLVDLNKIELLAGKGAQRLLDLALLLQIQNLPYVVLLDNDDAGRSALESFPKEGIPKERIILLPIPPGQQDAEIEDLFPVEMYAKAFHRIHGKQINLQETECLHKFRTRNGKVTNRAKELLEGAGFKYKLNKTSIAYEIAAILESSDELADDLVERFLLLIDSIANVVTIYKSN